MSIETNKTSISKHFNENLYMRWLILIALTLVFAVILYPSLLIKKHTYSIGDVAERNIKSSRDFFVEDAEATESNRKQAVDSVLTVYDYDATSISVLNTRVKDAFSSVRSIYNINEITDSNTIHDRIWKAKNEFETQLGISVSDDAYAILEKERFSEKIAGLISKITTEILITGVVTDKEALLLEADKGITLRTIGTDSEKVEANLKQYYGLDQAKTMVRVIGQPLLKNADYDLLNLVVDFSQSLIIPNISLNHTETKIRKTMASDGIKPFMYQIKAGEMILREGERVTRTHLAKLSVLNAKAGEKQIITSSAGIALLLFCLFMVTYIVLINTQKHASQNHNKDLIFISSMLVVFFFIARISTSIPEAITEGMAFSIPASSLSYGIPLSSGAMTICLFMQLRVAVLFALILSTCTAILFGNNLGLFLYFFLNSTMAAYWLQNCRERKVFIKAGLKLGLLNVLIVTALNFYSGNFTAYTMLWDWGFAFISGGIIAGVITAGFAPLVELAFDYTTDIKLLELANLDRPILRKLMLEAPGTYHHSVIVGSLVEAAAAEIGANPLLAKVCGYYHDIGKVNKPLYFIENQSDGKNRHDKLAPSMSSLILISHIKDGYELAKEIKLGQTIMDTIRQHHGTSLIKYFYEKAVQLRGKDAVRIEDFKYPGPKPQTREVGLVMLADVVEAASRTLENPTPARIQWLVHNLISKVFSDGQLDNCELTLKDLHNIAKSFNTILNGIHHHRIEYPEKVVADTSSKDKHGSSDKKQPKPAPDIQNGDTEDRSAHLKRLGLS
ncbi:MAG: HDIG domain-containing protein [Desulfobacterales bacterium]|nr:HDIG domain-containing protein [Desulfobacterales bacterium]